MMLTPSVSWSRWWVEIISCHDVGRGGGGGMGEVGASYELMHSWNRVRK